MSVCVVIGSQEEAEQLKELALRVVGGLEKSLEIWVALPEVPDDQGWQESLAGVGIEKVRSLSGANRRRLVKDAVKEGEPSLLIVAKYSAGKDDEVKRRFARDLFEGLSCQVLVVRTGEGSVSLEGKVLVPCAGGRHSRRALKIAHALVGAQTVAFQVRADVDELSQEVGQAHLEKIVRKAGLDPDLLHTKVVLGDDFREALRLEVESDDYIMFLVGASDSGSLRGKLFGTLPDRLVNQGGVTIGVLRAEKPVGHRMRDAVGRLIHVKVPQLNRLERLALFDEVESKSRWNFDFVSLMVLATSIAGMGLLLNSPAVVIGAMLVAPLMMPLLGTGLSLAQGNWPLCRRSLGAVMRGFCFALAIGLGMGFVAHLFDLGMTPELEARGKPNLLDLGVAFVSGIAAAYCVARPKLSGALAGVAIAAALVPPIATVGISFALGDFETSRCAAFLFGINVIAVVLGASLNFVLAGIRGRGKDGEWARRGLIVLMLLCAGLAVPLTSLLFSRLSRDVQIEEVVTRELPRGVSLVEIQTVDDGGYEIVLESSKPVKRELQIRVSEAIRKARGRNIKVRLRTELVIE